MAGQKKQGKHCEIMAFAGWCDFRLERRFENEEQQYLLSCTDADMRFHVDDSRGCK